MNFRATQVERFSEAHKRPCLRRPSFPPHLPNSAGSYSYGYGHDYCYRCSSMQALVRLRIGSLSKLGDVLRMGLRLKNFRDGWLTVRFVWDLYAR